MTYLSQRPFAPEAERKVRKRLSAAGIDVDSLTGDSLEDARLAMMHECTAVLCLTAPQQLRQTLIQVVTEVQQCRLAREAGFSFRGGRRTGERHCGECRRSSG